MPYYIYRITELGPVKQLEKLTEYAVFQEASLEAKRLRKDPDLPPNVRIKIIHAANELQAEDLLNQVREPEPMTGDEW